MKNLGYVVISGALLLVFVFLVFPKYQAANLPFHAVLSVRCPPGQGVTVPLQLDGQAYPFHLNLGQRESIIFRSYGKRFAQHWSEYGVLYVQPQVQLGSYFLPQKFSVLPEYPGSLPAYAGTLGSDFFEESFSQAGTRVELDVKKQQLTVLSWPSPPRFIPSAHAITLPLYESSDHMNWTVPVRLNDRVTLELPLSTASATTRIPWNMLKTLLDAKTAARRPLSAKIAVTVGTRTQLLQCDTLPDVPELGSLGLDAFANYKIIADYHNKTLYLEPYD